MKTLVITAYLCGVTAVAAGSLIPLTGAPWTQGAAKDTLLPADSLTAKVDHLFAEWSGSDSPGCSLGVSRKGVLAYARGYGMANLETGTPITPASVFHVASISKQFTAMSVLLLAQQGRLSLDDEVRKHIAEWADAGNRLTIRHLLTHTGGLRDAFLLIELAAPRSDGGDPNDALVRILARQRGLNAPPGTEYHYSNAGYTLRAAIVQRVTRQSLRAFSEANIFEPLGMTHTHVHDDPSVIVANRASGYSRDSGGVRVALRADPGGLVGNTGLFTTAPDLNSCCGAQFAMASSWGATRFSLNTIGVRGLRFDRVTQSG